MSAKRKPEPTAEDVYVDGSDIPTAKIVNDGKRGGFNKAKALGIANGLAYVGRRFSAHGHRIIKTFDQTKVDPDARTDEIKVEREMSFEDARRGMFLRFEVAAQRYLECTTREDRSAIARRIQAERTAEQRSEDRKKQWSTMTPARRAERARKIGAASRDAHAAKSPEQRSEIAHRRAEKAHTQRRAAEAAAKESAE